MSGIFVIVFVVESHVHVAVLPHVFTIPPPQLLLVVAELDVSAVLYVVGYTQYLLKYAVALASSYHF